MATMWRITKGLALGLLLLGLVAAVALVASAGGPLGRANAGGAPAPALTGQAVPAGPAAQPAASGTPAPGAGQDCKSAPSPAAAQQEAAQQAAFGAAASTLGLTPEQLKQELANGKTLADLAQAKGVAVQQVKDAMLAAGRASLDAAVKNNQLTRAEADTYYNDALVPLTDKLTMTGAANPRAARTPAPGQRAAGQAAWDAAASALGLTRDQLTQQLDAGKSVADLARAKGLSIQQVKERMLAAGRASLNDAVKNGQLTQAQADDTYNGLVVPVTGKVTTVNTQPKGSPAPAGAPSCRPNTPAQTAEQAIQQASWDAAAATLGVDPAFMKRELAGGQSIADLARAKGIRTQQIRDAMLTAGRNQIADAVKRGALTQAQADQLSSNLPNMVDEMLNTKPRVAVPGTPVPGKP
ncbi:MAG TPA: hypothetical protein VFW96_26715 [Thermomicrobiales bacterium]|nr:hypothetical protein [Thermomicrobiales bacterium]